MTHDYSTFEKFSSKDSALELVALLKANDIDYQLEDHFASLDGSFPTSGSIQEFRVKLRNQDFGKVEKIIEKLSAEQFDNLPENYYLLEFTDQELLDVISNRDEWNTFDFVLAQKLLKDRGKEIAVEEVNKLKEKRLNELRKPEGDQKKWILIGYGIAVFGGLLAIFIGWYLKNHKKTLPNGEQVYAYSESNRISGHSIFVTGIFFFVFWAMVRIFYWLK